MGKNANLRIAFCGTRGVPANYGGFETAVDEISRRFVKKGCLVDIFCRKSHSQVDLPEHEGRRLIYVDGAERKKLETVASSIQTGRYLLEHRAEYRHIFWFNNANFPGIALSLLTGVPVSVNTDGLEWRRKKWSTPFKAYYLLTSFLVSRTCPRIISDSLAIQAYYRKHFWRKSIFIPYGIPTSVSVSKEDQRAVLQKYGVEGKKYFLQVTRFEPDNLPLELARGFTESGLVEQGYHFVVVGYKDPTPYAQTLNQMDGMQGVIVLPAIYDPHELLALRNNSFCYLHGNSVGGTNPALLEAMATCSRVLAIDTEFSREVLAETGSYFKPHAIPASLKEVVKGSDQRSELRKRVTRKYQWNAVANSYMQIAEGAEPSYSPEPVSKETSPFFGQQEVKKIGVS